jgi:hypothetical protein
MDYTFRRTEAQWSDLALFCDTQGDRQEVGSRGQLAFPSIGLVGAAASQLIHPAPFQDFLWSDLQDLSSSTLLEPCIVVSEVKE